MRYIILILLILSSSNHALSLQCSGRNRLTVKCEAGRCDRGFLIPFKATWKTCGLSSDFSEKDQVLRMGSSVTDLILSKGKPVNGVYNIDFLGMGRYGSDPIDRIECLKLNENGELHLSCDNSRYVVSSLDVGAKQSLEDIKHHLIQESRWESFRLYLEFYFPLFLIVILGVFSFRWIRWKKGILSFSLTFLISLYCILGGFPIFAGQKVKIFGPLGWGLIGIFICMVWFVLKLIKQRK